MTTTRTLGAAFDTEPPRITRRDLARFVEEGRQWRAAETDRLLRSLGRGLARLGRALAGASEQPTAATRQAR